MSVKPSKPKTSNGIVFYACYVVDDWGVCGYFIGDNYKCSAAGTHSLSAQTDYRIIAPFTATVLFQDGTIQNDAHIVLIETVHGSVSDMGHSYPVTNYRWGFKTTVLGTDVSIPVERLMFQLSSIKPL